MLAGRTRLYTQATAHSPHPAAGARVQMRTGAGARCWRRKCARRGGSGRTISGSDMQGMVARRRPQNMIGGGSRTWAFVATIIPGPLEPTTFRDPACARNCGWICAFMYVYIDVPMPLCLHSYMSMNNGQTELSCRETIIHPNLAFRSAFC